MIAQFNHSTRPQRDAADSVRDLIASESGLISWATLLAVVGFLALIAIMFNVGRIANEKLETQNAADSIAYSTALVEARAMNAITASNHMMGELTALYVMHHAIGGKVLDRGEQMNNWVVSMLNIALKLAFVATEIAAFTALPEGTLPTNVLPPVDDVPRGEATVYDAKCLLKTLALGAYAAHMDGTLKIQAGRLLVAFFGIGFKVIAAGRAEQQAANATLREIKREYQLINRIEQFAIRTKSIKLRVIPALLKSLWTYEQLIVNGIRLKAAETVSHIANANRMEGDVLGRPGLSASALAQGGIASVTLPVVKDTTEYRQRSQLLRATYPWVREWRSKILLGLDALALLSRASRFYEYHSDVYSLEICEEFRRVKGYRLYVLEQMDPNRYEKGMEPWTRRDNSSSADRMFCLVGLARQRRQPNTSHRHIFPTTNPQPIASMAQAMLYNANSQRPGQGLSRGEPCGFFGMLFRKKPVQPAVGWDTLNWTQGATEWENGKDYFSWLPDSLHFTLGMAVVFDFVWPPDYCAEAPQVRLNWQAKLVPVATSNLALRIPLARDAQIRDRLINQILPAIGLQKLGGNYFHH